MKRKRVVLLDTDLIWTWRTVITLIGHDGHVDVQVWRWPTEESAKEQGEHYLDLANKGTLKHADYQIERVEGDVPVRKMEGRGK
jgi:hypothetical protein